MSKLGDFLCWYKNKDVVPTLKALQKRADVHHSKGIDMLKLAFNLPNFAETYLHESITASFIPSQRTTRILFEKKMQRHDWWTVHCLYEENCYVRDSCYWFNKLVQNFCWSWCQSTFSSLYVLSDAYRSVHKMGTRFWSWNS